MNSVYGSIIPMGSRGHIGPVGTRCPHPVTLPGGYKAGGISHQAYSDTLMRSVAAGTGKASHERRYDFTTAKADR